MEAKPSRTVLITGASGGLGSALARQYARAGIRLLLCGRSQERLDQIAADCVRRGAEVHVASFDVTDRGAVQTSMDEFARQFSLDLAILAAGVWHGTTDNKIEDRALSDDIVAVNWTGTLNTIYAILPHMMRSGGGQIALISSIASHLGLEQSPAYCASKAALRIYGQGLGALLSRHGIAVTVVLPGFVDTSMLATFSGYRPGLVSAEKAARTIQHALQRKKPTCYFPLRALIGVLIVRMLPRAVQEYIARVVCRNFG